MTCAKAATLIAGAAAVLVLTATPAHADDQNGYMSYLESHGINRQSISEGELVTLGEAECQKMRAGHSEDELTYALEAYKSNAESSIIVVGAHHYLCPDAPVAYSSSLPKR
jgi:hypothetical protein